MMVKKSLHEKIEKIANDMRVHHEDLTIHTFLLVESTSDVINRYFSLCSGRQKVSKTGFKVLNMLILNGGSMNPTEISREVFRSKHSVSKVIYTLENHGWVKIVPAGEDRRKKEVRITARGVAVAKKGTIYSRENISKEVLGVLSEKEKKIMHDMLKRVREHTLSLIGDKTY